MLFAILKKVLIVFTTFIENVNGMILKQAENFTTKSKINYQINEKNLLKKVEMCYLQSLN